MNLQMEIEKIEKRISLTDSLSNNLLRIESDKRGFQLTGDVNYLKNIFQLKTGITEINKLLRKNIIINNNTSAFSEIDSLASLRIAKIDSGIIVHTTQGIEESIKYMQREDNIQIRSLLASNIEKVRTTLQQLWSENSIVIHQKSKQNITDLLILLAVSVIMMFVTADVIKKSQQRIIKSHRRFKEAQRIAKIGSWEWDIATNKIKWSAEQFNIYGEDRKTFTLTYDGYLSHLRPEDQVVTEALIKEALEGKSVYAIEHEVIRKDGTSIIVFEQGTVLYDKKNIPIGMFGTTQDITVRKKFEEEVKRSEEKYKLLFHKSPLPMWITEIKTKRIIDVNETAIRNYGYNREEFLQLDVWKLSPGNDVEKFTKWLDKNYDDPAVQSGVWQHIKKDKSIIDVEASSHRIIYENKPCRLVVTTDITERKKAAEELIEAQKKFQQIFDNTADGIYHSSIDGKFIMANPSMAKIFGYDSPDELINSITNIGKQIYADPAQRSKMAELILAQGHIENHEIQVVKKNKEIIWVSANIRIVKNDHGAILYFEGILEDITEHKNSEEAIKRANERYDLVVLATSDGIWEWNFETGKDYFSPQWCEILGYEYHDKNLLHTYKSWEERIHRDHLSIVKKALNDHLESKKPFDVEYLHLHKSGNYHWHRIIGKAIFDDYGKAIRMAGSIRDISIRKKAEENLLNLSNRMKLAVKATSIGIWDWDIVNNVSEWDDEMYKIYNVDPLTSKSVNDSWTAAVHPEDLERVNEELRLAIEERKEYDTEFRVIWKDGTIHYVKGNALVLKDQHGIPQHMVGTNTDITGRKEAEIEILQLNQSLDQFANITAHDLQEPIRMVSGFLGLLEKKYGDALDEQGKSYVFRAKDGADRMSILIKDLLEFSRSGNKAAKKEPVDFAVVMDLVKKDLSIVMTDTGATLNIPESLPKVTGTQSALYRLILNLISNGIKFRKKDTAPVVNFSVKESPDFWEFTLQDNGIGVAEKDQPKLFQAFQRLHRRDEYPGTGLGLVTCKKIVETHGGKIWMTSEVGNGTGFHFTINKEQ